MTKKFWAITNHSISPCYLFSAAPHLSEDCLILTRRGWYASTWVSICPRRRIWLVLLFTTAARTHHQSSVEWRWGTDLISAVKIPFLTARLPAACLREWRGENRVPVMIAREVKLTGTSRRGRHWRSCARSLQSICLHLKVTKCTGWLFRRQCVFLTFSSSSSPVELF